MARPRSFDKYEVVRTALDLFWSNGYAGTRASDVCAAVGLGKGSIYGAFGDKRQLFLEVLDDYGAKAIGDAHSALDGPDSGAFARLRSYMVEDAALVAANPPRGCLVAKATAELAGKDAAVTTNAHRTFYGIQAILRSTIEGAQRGHDIDPAADANQLAALLLAVLRGLEALGRAGRTRVFSTV